MAHHEYCTCMKCMPDTPSSMEEAYVEAEEDACLETRGGLLTGIPEEDY